MTTGVRISFELYDETAKEDAAYSATSAQPWVDYDDLTDGLRIIDDDPMNPLLRQYTTGEKDAFCPDGMTRFFPDFPPGNHMGYYSAVMSGTDGTFSFSPVLICRFDEEHSSVGVTVYFDISTRLDSFRVDWLEAGGGVISTKTVTDNRQLAAFVENHIDGYRGVRVTAIKTDAPHRYVKIQQIDFGQRMVYDAGNLVTASVMEEVDLSGASAPAGSLQFSALDPEQRLNPVNPAGIYAFLRKGIPLRVEFLRDNAYYPGGIYYLDTWDGSAPAVSKMTAVNVLGKTDQKYESRFYTAVPPVNLLRDICDKLGVTAANDALQVSTLTGHIPESSMQEAIAHVCLCSGGFARAERQGGVHICTMPDKSMALTGDDVLGTPTATRIDRPGNFEIEVNRYTSPDHYSPFARLLISPYGVPDDFLTEVSIPYHGSFNPEGVNDIGKDVRVNPEGGVKSCLIYSDRLVVKHDTNWSRIECNYIAVAVEKTVYKVAEETPGGTVSIKDIPLISTENYGAVLAVLKAFYSRNLRLKFRTVWRPGLDCGTGVYVPTQFGSVTGIITRMDINLTGGLLATVEVVA